MMRAAFATIAMAVAFSTSAYADIGGGTFIPVEDTTTHGCINVSKYNVSMMLVALQAKRTDNFWKKSKSLGAKFDVSITNQKGEPFKFPRGIQLSTKEVTGDIAFLPVKFPIMSKYNLSYENSTYVNIGLDLYIINLERESQTVHGVFQFIEFSKSLPLPPNPYVQGVQLFGDFAQKIVSDNVVSTEEKLPVATFSFDLASSDEDVNNCPSMGLREGIQAIIFESSEQGSGFIRIEETSKYCFYLNQSSLRLTTRPKAGSSCNNDAVETIVKNPLVAFVVAKWSKTPSSTTPVAALTGINPIQREKLTPRLFGITENSAQLALSRQADTFPKDQKLNASNVKIIFDALNRTKDGVDLREKLEEMGKNQAVAGVVEAETAVNLHLCSLAGISAVECP